MKLSDLTVEVRDIDLVRIGQIRPEDLDLEYVGLFNAPGTWKITLPIEHPMAPQLRSPGAGIIITGPDGALASGPVTLSVLGQSPSDPGGTISFTGVTDDIILNDLLAFPQPSNSNPTTQTLANDVRTGAPETIMHEFVSNNIGPLASVARKKANLSMGTDGARPIGVTTTKSSRFQKLGVILSEIALPYNLGFRVIQRGTGLAFETYLIADRSAQIRLDVRNGSVLQQKVSAAPPGVTRVIVAGQSEGVARQFLYADSTESLLGEAQWGRRIERFVDQRNTDDWAELQQAADEVLVEEGVSGLSIEVVPAEDTYMEFGRDWFLGDKVSVVVEVQELPITVTGFILKAGSGGFFTGVQLGDATGFDPTALIRRRLVSSERRISQLERSQ